MDLTRARGSVTIKRFSLACFCPELSELSSSGVELTVNTRDGVPYKTQYSLWLLKSQSPWSTCALLINAVTKGLSIETVHTRRYSQIQSLPVSNCLSCFASRTKVLWKIIVNDKPPQRVFCLQIIVLTYPEVMPKKWSTTLTLAQNCENKMTSLIMSFNQDQLAGDLATMHSGVTRGGNSTLAIFNYSYQIHA